MISYIKGEITWKTPEAIVVETGGVGYLIHISRHTYLQVQKLEKVKILTHFLVKEDSQTLYGFADDDERNLFRHLLSVNGVGPATAQTILSGMNPEETRAAIIGEHVNAFKSVKGIGPKTAKRIILDLKDKLMKDGGALTQIQLPAAVDNTMREEALKGLLGLGFNRIAVQKVLNKILREQKDIDSVESLIRAGLKELR